MQFRLRRASLANALAACLVCGATFQASSQLFTTVGVYDEPLETNSVDFVATGSTLNFVQFKEEVATAFAADFGGVNQCYAIGLNSGPYTFSYGASQTKRLRMTGPTSPANNEIGITGGGSFIQTLSGNGAWVSGRPEMTFYLGDVSSSVPNEAVTKFGLTILSTAFFSLSNVTATATFSGGGTAIASRLITEAPGLGDTFFGFAAPSGQSILKVTFRHAAGHSMPFDDIGFITAPIAPLTISRIGPSQVRVAWPTNATTLSLECATNMPASLWIANTNTPNVLGDRFALDFDALAGGRFYRLASP